MDFDLAFLLVTLWVFSFATLVVASRWPWRRWFKVLLWTAGALLVALSIALTVEVAMFSGGAM